MSINCPGGSIYLVQAGDTFYLIAQRFGLTIQQLSAANPQVTNPAVLQVGQSLCIPGAAAPSCPGFQYTIAAGDTLFALAARYGTSVTQILNYNPGLDPNRLLIGQQICIPAAAPARSCLVLSPTDIAPNAEGVIFLNPATNHVLVAVTNVPAPTTLPSGQVYKVWLARGSTNTFVVATMAAATSGVWAAGLTAPVADLQAVLVTAEPASNVTAPQGLGVATAQVA